MAYGINAPFGLKPFTSLTGSTFNGQQNQYPVASGYANSIFTGDPVFQNADGTIGTNANQAGIGAAQAYIGVFNGIKYQDANGVYQTLPFWIGGTVTKGAQNAQASIIDDPNVIWTIQVATSAGAPGPVNAVGITQANLNQNANVGIGANTYNPVNGPQGIYTPNPNPGSGSTTFGISGYYLDFSTIANTATLPLKIVGFDPNTNPGQVFFQAGPPTVGVFNNALVIINNDAYKGGTGTAGV